VLHSPGLLIDHSSQLGLALDAGAGRSSLALLLKGVSCAGNAILLLQQIATGCIQLPGQVSSCCMSAILYHVTSVLWSCRS
jgi:hypothetical protein